MSGPRPQRLVNKADFERLLGTRWCGRSAHFALHHVSGVPATPQRVAKGSPVSELSTGPAPICTQSVDNAAATIQPPAAWWFGCVVPKRHAKRAVTRNLIKRQARSAFERLHGRLPAGLWVLRLRSPFGAEFVSARSPALAAAARQELDGLLQKLAA